MSRVEKHRARREGDITGVGKSDESTSLISDNYNVNPIIRRDEKEIKRQKSYDEPLEKPVIKSIEASEVEKNSRQREVFDIDVEFAKLQRSIKIPDQDTQLQIISELFSDNAREYNDVSFEKKEDATQKLIISEADLIKLLEDREKARKKLMDRRKKEKKKEIKTNDEPKIYKDVKYSYLTKAAINEPVVEKVVEIEPILKKEIQEIEQNIEYNFESNMSEKKVEFLDNIDTKNNINNLEKELEKKPWTLIVIAIILVIVLIYILFTIFR